MKSFIEYSKDEPSMLILHGKHSFKGLNESTLDDWIGKNDNDHIGSNVKEQAEQLHNQHQLDDEDKTNIKRYTSGSNVLNRKLYYNSIGNSDIEENIDGHDIPKLDKSINRNIGTNLSSYSGLRFDPTKDFNRAKRMNNGIVKLPAYTSTSIDKNIAHRYAEPTGFSKTRHIIHFHLDNDDNGTFVGNHSAHPGESELLLPRNTRIKLLHEEELDDDGPVKTKIWHVQVHKE